MERKFFTDDFESLLKENADQFKMIPSKKVWHGIYNDMHPGRRWPSVAIGLLFIFTLVMVGYLNTQQSEHSYLVKIKKEAVSSSKANLPALNNSYKKRDKITISQKNNKAPGNILVSNMPGKNPFVDQTGIDQTSIIDQPVQDEKIKTGASENLIPPASNASIVKDVNTGSREKLADNTDKVQNQNLSENSLPATSSIDVVEIKKDFNDVTPTNLSEKNLTIINNAGNESTQKNIVAVNTTAKHKNQAETEMVKAAAHVSFLKKIHKNSKINWEYYLGPSVSYRIYSKAQDNANVALSGLIYSNSDLNKAVTHMPSLGFEAGTAMKYALNKKLKFTSGFQVNYSSYSVQANNIHPIMATLLLYNESTAMPYSVSSISYYGNGPGAAPIKLHNYSVQLSIPVGLEYKIAGNDNIQLDLAGTFQPSFIVTNQAYLLSTDKQNYLTQANLSRKWNMSTNLGTFVTLNAKKLQWQFGPEVRYQLLSSYKNAYHLKEHLVDYGIRLGISKSINK